MNAIRMFGRGMVAIGLILMVVLSGSYCSLLCAGELANEIKKITNDVAELDTLLVDYKDVIEMGDIKQAKNLNFRLKGYVKILAKVKELGQKVQKLETEVEKNKEEGGKMISDAQSCQSELSSVKAELGTCKSDLGSNESKLQLAQTESQSSQSKIWDAQSKLRDGQTKLQEVQSKLTMTQTKLNDCESKLDMSQRNNSSLSQTGTQSSTSETRTNSN